MSGDASPPQGPDLAGGIPLAALEDGQPFLGRFGEAPVMLVRRGAEIFAIGATCSHYGGPLAEGLLVGDTVRCPWHHACFSLRSGRTLRAPALRDVPAWKTTIRYGRVYLAERVVPPPVADPPTASPASIVVVGAGAAGSAAVEALRSGGYQGPLALVDPDPEAPYDRPNLSKDFLAGSAPAEWLPLFDAHHYSDLGVDRLEARVEAIQPMERSVQLDDGRSLSWEALLLATGATPVRPALPGVGLPHVHVLRSLSDCRSIVARAESKPRVVIIGTGFIGLEAAAALRSRGLAVSVIGRDAIPFARVLGPELGGALLAQHRSHGVAFHLQRTVKMITPSSVQLDDGTELPADLVLVAVGVRPELRLAEDAGLAVDNGIVVDRFLATSVPGIWAAGDSARYPDPLTGDPVRIEHWAVAQRQGQVAAANMLGGRRAMSTPPFFWTHQFDLVVSYVGHAASWDDLAVDGDIRAGSATVRYSSGGQLRAVATIGRDRASLEAEVALEKAAGE